MRKTAFLDRDGVINKDVNYLHRKEDIELLEGSAEAIRILNENYFLTIVVSNQSAVARGMMSEKQVEEINGEVDKLIEDLQNPKKKAEENKPLKKEGKKVKK